METATDTDLNDLTCPNCGAREDQICDTGIRYVCKTVYLDMQCARCKEEWTEVCSLVFDETEKPQP